MLTLEIIGAGFASASRPEDVAAANRRLVDFKRRTQQRYLDNSIGFGLTALADAITSTGLPQDKIDAAPQRAGLLLATRSGPVATRESYLESYLSRGKRSVSATLFSNCGYNIVGALLARSHNLRGPVLCFGAGGAWSWLLLTTARRMFAAGRVDHLFIGEVASDRAMILALAPAGRIVAAAPSLAVASNLKESILTAPDGTPLPLEPGDLEMLWDLARRWWPAPSPPVPA